jgi:hypothetical protein
MVQGAGSIYDAQVRAAQGNVANLMDLYKTAAAEEEARRKAANSGGLDLASILASVGGNLGVNAPSLDDIFGAPAPHAQAKPQPKVNLSGSIKTAGIPGATSLPQGSGSGDWLLSPVINWFKGLSAPQNNYKSLSDLGLQ